MYSIFDIFKVSIGPSSSHTMGPMIAGKHFRDLVTNKKNITRIEVKLYGSLAYTGKAHGSEKGIALGLEGFTAPVIGSCADHESGGSIFVQQWDGSDWKRVTDLIPPMSDVVRPLLTAAAAKYVSDKSGWTTQKCN